MGSGDLIVLWGRFRPVDALCKLCPDAGAREQLLGTFLHFTPCKSQEASEFQAPVGRTCMALWKHIWAGSVGFPVFGICHRAQCHPLPRTLFPDTQLQRAPLCGEQWMIREVMWTQELKLRARMRGLKEAKRRI